ncbi:hypothetical protein BU17DRAFT_62188 [Hysterangium stoloniferum]|nr:hypothetical protein BU17DRAFT_62188 [Hysterangium stoloniferum]
MYNKPEIFIWNWKTGKLVIMVINETRFSDDVLCFNFSPSLCGDQGFNVWQASIDNRDITEAEIGIRRYSREEYEALKRPFRYAFMKEPKVNMGHAWPPLSRLAVLDFHPIRCREETNDDIFYGELPWSIENYPASSPTVISDRQWWHSDVVTTLPYREVISRKTYKYDRICINDEYVIGKWPYSVLDANQGRRSRKIDILYFLVIFNFLYPGLINFAAR